MGAMGGGGSGGGRGRTLRGFWNDEGYGLPNGEMERGYIDLINVIISI